MEKKNQEKKREGKERGRMGREEKEKGRERKGEKKRNLPGTLYMYSSELKF
jgi:hypothetical protein